MFHWLSWRTNTTKDGSFHHFHAQDCKVSVLVPLAFMVPMWFSIVVYLQYKHLMIVHQPSLHKCLSWGLKSSKGGDSTILIQKIEKNGHLFLMVLVSMWLSMFFIPQPELFANLHHLYEFMITINICIIKEGRFHHFNEYDCKEEALVPSAFAVSIQLSFFTSHPQH
jgi:hypothetical protein